MTLATRLAHALLMPPLAMAAWQSTARVATSPDGTRIAYDVTGRGPAIMLLHGGGGSRRAWHDAGYVSRLSHDFTVITVDLRGHGDSDKPTAVPAYAIDWLTADCHVGARRRPRGARLAVGDADVSAVRFSAV